jgi:hypothetical protein
MNSLDGPLKTFKCYFRVETFQLKIQSTIFNLTQILIFLQLSELDSFFLIQNVKLETKTVP